jgi:hypothetical protein
MATSDARGRGGRGTSRHSWIGAGALLALVAAAAGAGCASAGASRQPAAAAPQLLDPLTPAERASAETLVRADARAIALLGEGATLASADFLALKGERDDAAVRHVDLLFARAARDFGVRAVVRLGAAPAVIEVDRVAANSVPMTPQDVDQAWKIALADPAFTARLARDPSRVRVEALRLFSDDRDDPCFAGRCFYLIVRDGAYYISEATAVVDLATARVLSIGRRPQ